MLHQVIREKFTRIQHDAEKAQLTNNERRSGVWTACAFTSAVCLGLMTVKVPDVRECEAAGPSRHDSLGRNGQRTRREHRLETMDDNVLLD